MSISTDDVLRIAALARLRLSEAEVPRMSAQLSSILEHMEALGRADVEGIPPVVAVTGAAAPLREDRVAPDALHLAPAETAPAWEEGFFLVPRLAALDADAVEGGA